MDPSDELLVPNAAEDEARADPLVAALADVIGAVAATDGLVSPGRFEAAVAVAQEVGNVVGEPSLTRVLVLRALASPNDPRAAIAALKPHAGTLSGPDRAAVARALAALLGEEAKPAVADLAPDLATALGVPLPDRLRRRGPGVRDALGGWTDRMKRMVRSEPPLVAAARDFALEFGDLRLVAAISDAQRTGDTAALADVLRLSAEAVGSRAKAVARAAEAQSEALATAAELEAAADRIERVARQRYAAITRRAAMLKRHLRDDLHALIEDAAEEFEVDFRRMADAGRGWFGQLATEDLNDRLVVKNLERRYLRLARRYQDQLDLLDREVSEFCEEFTRIGDEALRPIARHEFRAVAPNPRLELRVKAAADRASGRTLAAGAVGAAAAGAAVQAGFVAATSVVAVVATPVGIAVLGAVALAGVWKAFATPGERRRRDMRERTRELEDGLRAAIMANQPRFEEAVDAVVARFRSAAVPDIAEPRVEAERLREIATIHQAAARAVVEAANARLQRLMPLLETARMPPLDTA